jgi:hypothetical protein
MHKMNYLWHCFQWISQLSQEKSKIIQPQCLPANQEILRLTMKHYKYHLKV